MAVLKNNGLIRVCINFTNLSKACQMHPYLLPRINELVDEIVGYLWLSFLDAFLGYNQVPLKEQDQIHMSFITNKALYCYRVIPFGLKNKGTTY